MDWFVSSLLFYIIYIIYSWNFNNLKLLFLNVGDLSNTDELSNIIYIFLINCSLFSSIVSGHDKIKECKWESLDLTNGIHIDINSLDFNSSKAFTPIVPPHKQEREWRIPSHTFILL